MRHMWQNVMYQKTVILSWRKLTCGWGNCNTCHEYFDKRMTGIFTFRRCTPTVQGSSRSICMHCLWGNIENKEGFKTAHKICNKIGKTTKEYGPLINHGLFQPGQIHRMSSEVRRPFLVFTNLLQAFVKGSGCLLGSLEQTNLRNHLSQIHFKKSLLSLGKMESPIEFICTYDLGSESFLSNYRLICHLSGGHSSIQRWDKGED